MTKIDNYVGIRNFVVKTILALVGLYFVIGTGHKHVWDLCNELQWDKSDSAMMFCGFALAAGAALYNNMIEAAIERFKSK